jgi:U2-associated protein SR140
MPNYFVGKKKSATKQSPKKAPKKVVRSPGAPVSVPRSNTLSSKIQGLELQLRSIQTKSNQCDTKLNASNELISKLQSELASAKKESEKCIKQENEMKHAKQRDEDKKQKERYERALSTATLGKDTRETAQIKKEMWAKYGGKMKDSKKAPVSDVYDLSSLFGSGIATPQQKAPLSISQQQQHVINKQKEAREAYLRKQQKAEGKGEYQPLLSNDDGWTGESALWGLRHRKSKKSARKSKSPKKSARKSKSPKKSGRKSKSPKKSARKSKSPKKSGRKSKSPKKSGRKSKSPKKSARKSKSPKKSGRKSKSPKKSGRKSKSPKKSGRKSKSPKKSGRKSKSPKKSGRKSKSAGRR